MIQTRVRVCEISHRAIIARPGLSVGSCAKRLAASFSMQREVDDEKSAAAAERLMRTLASGKGAAWKEFAKALDQYGQGGIDAGGVARIAGDLYFKEVGRVASIFAGAATDMLGWGLGEGRRDPEAKDASRQNPPSPPAAARFRHWPGR